MSVSARWFVVALAFLLILAGREPGRAQTLSLSCSISISTIAFGSVDVLTGAAQPTNGLLTITCLAPTILSGNLYVCIAMPARALRNGTKTLAYDIYGPAGSSSWSNTIPVVVPFSPVSLTTTYTQSISADVLASQQTVEPGDYFQTLNAVARYGTTACTAGLLSGSVNFSFQATATVTKSCNVAAANLSFGAVGDLNSAVDAQSSLTIQCSRDIGYAIGMNGGLSGATDPTARQMTAGGQTLTYGLYQNSARTTPWGTGASAWSGTGTAGAQVIPIYGRVPVQTTPPPGSYSDTVVVSVTY